MLRYKARSSEVHAKLVPRPILSQTLVWELAHHSTQATLVVWMRALRLATKLLGQYIVTTATFEVFNSLVPNDAIWRHELP